MEWITWLGTAHHRKPKRDFYCYCYDDDIALLEVVVVVRGISTLSGKDKNCNMDIYLKKKDLEILHEFVGCVGGEEITSLSHTHMPPRTHFFKLWDLIIALLLLVFIHYNVISIVMLCCCIFMRWIDWVKIVKNIRKYEGVGG